MITSFSRRLDLQIPLVQAPMAGVSTAALAAAVSGAGGLGSIAVGALTPEAADRAIAEAMQAAPGPLNVNVFAHPRPRRDRDREAAWLRTLAPAFAECGASPPPALEEIYRPFDDQPAMLEVLLAHQPAVVSFHFGVPAVPALQALKRYGACLMATATSVAEAREIEAAGFDVVIAQGYEAGGHRGSFHRGLDERLSTLTLLPRVAAAVSIPVVAAGGISSGQDVAMALASGADGVQMGTAFIGCTESAANSAYRQALQSPNMSTVMTALFSGRPARAIVNRFVRTYGHAESQAPAYPVAYDAAKRLAAAAPSEMGEMGAGDFAAMWAGQGKIRHQGLAAASLMHLLRQELQAAAAS
ncbi:MAG: NAD(P)H-dependent flavin oxidoreductase [Pseudomonadales bacterium]